MKSLKSIAIIFAITAFCSNIYCATKSPAEIKDKLTTLKQSLGSLKSKLSLLSKKLKTLNRKLKSKQLEESLKLGLSNKIDHLQKDSSIKIKYNNSNLKKFAEGLGVPGQAIDGYGYKVANLRELEEIAKEINAYSTANNLSFNVIIPTFAAIPSSKIKIFLKDNGIDLAIEWGNLKKEMGKTKPEQEAAIIKAFEAKKFPDTFLQSLEKLEKTIKDKFTQISDSKQEAEAVQIFTKYFNNENYDVTKTIKNIESDKKRLMVRSTGKEDTQEVANAGGNESVANVEPTCKDVLKAMGIGKKEGQLGVVSSYFSKKSFSQRLGIGDQSLFSQEPLTPVLIQKMIGEKQGGETETNKIPRVGVMFTEEAEGGYKTPGKSTGITIIQSAYGHNEGVVNGLISVDTYYVTNDGKVYPIIRYKKDRLVPSVNGLEKISNPKEIQNVPTLDHHAVLNLKFVANALEKYYGYPMDVEFVYESETNSINIVQARPITYKKNLPDPSFLKNVSQYKDTTLNGITIGAAGGSIRFINEKNQIIVSENLGQSLTTYIDSPNSKDVQCVITGEMAPATSHEATTFRGEGIPVIYVNDIQPVNNWIDTANFKIVVDPQQEVLINWTNQPEGSLKVLLNTDKVEKSWTNYPIPRQLSLIDLSKETKKLKSIFSPKEIFEFLSDTSKTEADMKQEYSQINNYKISELLQSIKQEPDKKKAKLSLARTVLQIHKKYFQIKKMKTLVDPSLLNLLDTIFDNIIKLARNVKTAIDKFEPTAPQRLFTIRLFEAALMQDPGMGEIINGYSFAKILKITKQEKKIKKTKPGLSEISIQLYKISDLAFTQQIKENWESFVTEWQKVAAPNEKDIKKSIKNKFAKLIITLGNLGLIPLWLHTFFATTYQLGKSKETGISLIEEFEAAETFINVIDEKMNTLNTFDVSGFEDPAKLEKSKKAFIDHILTYFKSNQFISDFRSTNNLGKLAGLKVMATLVDKFDLTIKTLKGSLKFDRKSIVLHEKSMLEEYFELLLQWISLLSLEQIKELSPLESNELWDQSENDFRTIIFYDLKQKPYFSAWKAGD